MQHCLMLSFSPLCCFPPFVLIGAVFVEKSTSALAADLLSDGSLAGVRRERAA